MTKRAANAVHLILGNRPLCGAKRPNGGLHGAKPGSGYESAVDCERCRASVARMAPKRAREKASDATAAASQEISRLLPLLDDKVSRSVDAGLKGDWGHVGDLNEIVSKLKQLVGEEG